jgi:hypothetical protein
MDGNPSGLRIIGTTSVELRAGRAYPSAMVKMQQTPMKSGFLASKGPVSVRCFRRRKTAANDCR